jgi:hypothetical protein
MNFRLKMAVVQSLLLLSVALYAAAVALIIVSPAWLSVCGRVAVICMGPAGSLCTAAAFCFIKEDATPPIAELPPVGPNDQHNSGP